MRAFACGLAISIGLMAGPAAAQPRRVVSLKLCTDELLLALAAPEQIASVTYLSQQEHETPLWRQARAYPKNDGSLMSVVRHRPDLVIDMGGGGRDSARIARRLGLKVIDLPLPQTIEDVERAIVQVAQAIGRPSAAATMVARISALKRSLPARRLDAIWLGGGGRTVSPTSLDAQWMALAGLRQRKVPGDRLSLEQLIVQPPAILLRSDYRSGQYSTEQRWLAHPLVRRARGSRTVPTEGRRWTCGGPPMIDEVLRLRREVAR
jgi:iron complex transport system substrate-binding protein